MANRNKRGIGTAFGVLGFALVILGLIFMIIGKTAVGIAHFAAGFVFLVIGLATARQAAPPQNGSGTRPPG
jgi:hypothetical protein